jgi:hypothetical protein
MCIEFAHEDGAVSGTAVDGQGGSMLSLKFALSMAGINLLVCHLWAGRAVAFRRRAPTEIRLRRTREVDLAPQVFTIATRALLRPSG